MIVKPGKLIVIDPQGDMQVLLDGVARRAINGGPIDVGFRLLGNKLLGFGLLGLWPGRLAGSAAV